MSCEDLEEALAKRAAEGKATASKRERGRRRKSPPLKAGSSVPKGKAVGVSKIPVPRDISAEPWRAPVARMYQEYSLEFA